MIRVARLLEQHVRFADAHETSGVSAAADTRRTWSERKTLLVVVEDAEGRVGLGEAAPLPDYSPDTLDDDVLIRLVSEPSL